jgi:hypothetical protein
MTSSDLERNKFIDELQDRSQIEAALLRYCRGLDRRDFDLVRSAYHADAFDDHGSYKGDIPGLIAWMEARHQHVDQCMHAISNVAIELNEDIAAVETYCTSYQRHFVDGDATRAVDAGSRGEPRRREQVIATARFIDRFERRGGEWRIAHRTVVFEALRSEVVTTDFPPPGWVTHSRDGQDTLWTARREILSEAIAL